MLTLRVLTHYYHYYLYVYAGTPVKRICDFKLIVYYCMLLYITTSTTVMGASVLFIFGNLEQFIHYFLAS